MKLSPLARFALDARAPEEVLDLESLCFGLARITEPDLDPRPTRAALDRIATAVADAVDRSAPPDHTAAALQRVLVGQFGFEGRAEAFASAEGSYLNRVVERRTGLPILLSAVWILVGQRVGLPLVGVGYPGHFLVMLQAPGAQIYIDPFRGGVQVEAQTLYERLPSDVSADDARRVLEPCGTRAMVVRMLNNLKNVWVEHDAHAPALEATERLLLMGGEDARVLRDRALLLLHLHRPGEALPDFTRYLELRPQAHDRALVETLMQRIRDGEA